MDDLIMFVGARLDEDEAALRAVEDSSEPWRGQWAPDDMNFALRTRNGWSLARAVTVEEGFPPGVLAHIARHDPARVLREVEAKRAVLAEHFAEDRGESLPGADCGVCYYIGTPGSPAPWPCLTLRAIAAVYSDHPDYRPEWKP